MSTSEREILARAQEALVRALLDGGEVPAGFDPHRLRLSGLALATKRRQAARAAWPGLAGALGEQFDRLFNEYAGAVPLPEDGGPLADGRGFAEFLEQRGLLPDAGRQQMLGVDLRFRRAPGGLLPRRGWGFTCRRLRQAGRLVLALRTPGGREFWLNLPFRLPHC